MSKLVLIDSMAILHRAYHALPPLTTRIGEPIGAVYGLTSMLLRIIQDLKPTHIAFCFDEEAPNFRRKEFADYQAQRAPVADELSSQFKKARDFAKAVGIPSYSLPGYEADDIIGTISKVASKEKLVDEVIVVTGDRDILQLVDDEGKVRLYMPITGLSNAKMFEEKEVVERMEVPPNLIPDYKGLVGDASDNYKGVPGIGPKTAANLLKEFGSFEGIYKNLENVPEKTRKKLVDGRASGELSLKLARIVREVPIRFDFDEMKKWKIDSDKLLGLFEEYGFRTLTKRVKEVGKQIVSENQGNLF